MADTAQARLDRRVRGAGPDERMRLHARLYRQAFELVWAQVDRADPMTPIETTRFLLRRLYPDLEGPRLEAIMRRLTADWHAGIWAGPRRPTPGDSDPEPAVPPG